MLTFVLHTLLLVVSVVVTFLWASVPALSRYNLQAVGIIVLLYFAGKIISKGRQQLLATIDGVMFTSISLLLILSTGGLHSPVFFLLYLLLFAISLIFEPIQSLLLTLTLLVVFLIDNPISSLETASIINLTTLIVITPLALVFGRKYLQTLEERGKIQILKNVISQEETDSLIWLSTKAKPTLINLLDTTSLIIGSNLLPFSLQQKLKSLHQDLISLHESASILEKEIDETGD